MHTFYLDKKNTFECQIDIEGASITGSKARLVLENKDGMKFFCMFYYKQDSMGSIIVITWTLLIFN